MNTNDRVVAALTPGSAFNAGGHIWRRVSSVSTLANLEEEALIGLLTGGDLGIRVQFRAAAGGRLMVAQQELLPRREQLDPLLAQDCDVSKVSIAIDDGQPVLVGGDDCEEVDSCGDEKADMRPDEDPFLRRFVLVAGEWSTPDPRPSAGIDDDGGKARVEPEDQEMVEFDDGLDLEEAEHDERGEPEVLKNPCIEAGNAEHVELELTIKNPDEVPF